ncbi:MULTISPECIES: CoA ester lyase [Pseudomonas]|uniref:HpcH/HpaI aldolase/citrate lyase family protein n=1 Tax=Pseudomonas TaxID=286 RepID=UPI00086374D1|nr:MULTISPECIES: CoA ester lyase [Pseudomonas]PJX06883.1 CoA ester lyase [Pseudomonas putida]
MTYGLPSQIRSALFVPGSRPDRFEKAFASGADCIIIDLEDAVEEEAKERARQNIDVFLTQSPKSRIVLRCNGLQHSAFKGDLELLAHHTGVAAIMLPKTETRNDVEAVAEFGKPVWGLIESAKGLANLREIASTRGIERLTFGALDLAVDLGLGNDEAGRNKVFDFVRYTLVVESRNAGLKRPLDTVCADTQEGGQFRYHALNARHMGLEGVLCIHPKQIGQVRKVFERSTSEIEWAKRVLEAAKTQPGAFSLDGQMVDAPVIAAARQLLQHQL